MHNVLSDNVFESTLRSAGYLCRIARLCRLTTRVVPKKTKPRCLAAPGFQRSRWNQHLTSSPQMKKERAKTEFELIFKLRMSNELLKWLVGLAISGGALSAAVHYL